MRKRVYILLTVCVILSLLSACANDNVNDITKQSTDSSSTNNTLSSQEKNPEHSIPANQQTSNEINTDSTNPTTPDTGGQTIDTQSPTGGEDSNGESSTSAHDYLVTREIDFSTAKKYFPNINECKASNFIKYEVEIAMPSNKAVAINYIFNNGKITIRDNTIVTFMPSDDFYESIKLEGRVYYVEKGYSVYDQTTIIFHDDENNLVYMASMKCSNGDLKEIAKVVEPLIVH